MESVLHERLPYELVQLVRQHGAAMKLQRRMRRRRARSWVRCERKRMRSEGEVKASACVCGFLDSFALGSQPMSGALTCWDGDLRWWKMYEPKLVSRMERVKSLYFD